MGYAYLYKCDNCNFEENFKLGYGFLVHPQSFRKYIEGNNKLFHYKIHNKIVQLGEKYSDLKIQASFRSFKCPKCSRLFEKTQVLLEAGGKVVHEAEFRCSHCRIRLKLTNIHRLKKAVCPACGKKVFRRQSVLDSLWD